MKDKTLTPAELAERWGCSVRTLSNWRWLRKGPPWHHLMRRGNPVVYKLADVIKWEKEHV